MRKEIYKEVNSDLTYGRGYVYSLQYHIVWCTKYRRKVLTGGAEDDCKALLRSLADEYHFQIPAMEVMPDHVHLLIDCNPRYGIMQCVKDLKRESASQIKKDFPHLTSRLPNIWTRSTFIATVGSVSLDVVKRYIENQKGV